MMWGRNVLDVMPETTPRTGPQADEGGEQHLKFARDTGFQRELRRRVEALVHERNIRERDCLRIYLKTAIVLAMFALSYYLLVFVANSWWSAVPLAVLLGITIAEIGFNIQHDGGHKAYSRRAWVNKVMTMTLDMVGGSSYVWRWKHAVFHHMYVNVAGHDTDIDLGIFGRLSPQQPRYVMYRWQQWYLWALYGLMGIKWQFYDDFRDVITGHMGENRFPRPRGWELALFVGGKLVFLTLAFGIPLLLHPLLTVVLFYVITVGVVGVVLSVIFQLAHAVEEARFPAPEPGTGRMQQSWAEHQAGSAVDFARDNSVLSWLVGGLNFQVEHHLFPTLCHVNYPAISNIVEDTCREYGVPYKTNPSFQAAVVSHYRWLKQMGAACGD